MTDHLLTRPLPTLEQWLAERGSDEKADGFPEFDDLIRRTLARDEGSLPPEQACFLRLWKGFGVAAIELCNLEHGQDVSPEMIVATMPRALACAAFYAAASVMEAGTPWRSVAKVLTEEFRFAANQCADQMTEAEERDAAAANPTATQEDPA